MHIVQFQKQNRCSCFHRVAEVSDEEDRQETIVRALFQKEGIVFERGFCEEGLLPVEILERGGGGSYAKEGTTMAWI